MAGMLQAKCPGCQNLLRIPADWTAEMVRCKHCGMVIRVRQKAPPAQAVPPLAQPAGVPASPYSARPPAPPAQPVPSGAVMGATPFTGLTNGPAAYPPVQQAHADQSFSGLDDEVPASPTRRYRRRKRGNGLKIAALALVLLALVGGGGAAYYFFVLKAKPPAVTEPEGGKSTGGSEWVKATGEFPRRMLTISVNNYLYANPVSYGEKPRSVGSILGKLCETFHVARDQYVELSDGADKAMPPLKPVIESTITTFLDTSRAQDRLIIFFIGHAVEIDDQGYLVPINGELTSKDTLIPLSWVYDKLSKCKARQKVLVMDVCRFDPSRGLERPGSGPMGEKLDAQLQNPPEGVQVWSACTAKQYSYEGYVSLPGNKVAHSGLFLASLHETVGIEKKKRVKLGIQRPDESLPLEVLGNGDGEVKGANFFTDFDADDIYKAKQTPRLAGKEAADGAPYDPKEPMPKPMVIPPPPVPPGGAAPLQTVQAMLKDVNKIPPVTGKQEGVQALTARSLPPLSAKLLEAYRDDGKMTPLRDAVREAIKVLEDEEVNKGLPLSFSGQAGDNAAKKLILEEQRQPAKIEARLREVMDNLKEAKKDLDDEKSKLWKAEYDYVYARVEAKIAWIIEYNYMRGQIRKDNLPPRDPAKSSGWRLASSPKLQVTESRAMVKDVKKKLETVAKEHAGTPFEILAKRELLTALGLQWQVTREGF